MTKPLATLTIPMPEGCYVCPLRSGYLSCPVVNKSVFVDIQQNSRHPDCKLKPKETVRISKNDCIYFPKPINYTSCTADNCDEPVPIWANYCPSCGREIEWVTG